MAAGFTKFKTHVSTVAQKAASGGIPSVHSVTNGESDGNLVITYRHTSLGGDVHIQALAQDVSEYPDGNMFMLWTDDPDPPPPIVAAIQGMQDYLIGMSVYEMVTELATRLDKEISRALNGGLESPDEADEEDDYDAAFDAEYPSDEDEFGLPSLTSGPSWQNMPQAENQGPLIQRIRRDLRQVKNAGYKVGFLDTFGKTSATGHVSISIRVDKLALSDEVLEAWDVKATEYVVLLLRFEKPYSPLNQVMDQAAIKTQVAFRIGKCTTYKPSISQALRSFSESNRPLTTDGDPNTSDTERGDDGATFEKFLVSNSLDSFLCESFVSLVKIRQAHNVGWERANEYLLSRIGLVTEDCRPPEPSIWDGYSNAVLGSDHLLEGDPKGERSFPLIAMQFAIRYFVKCTEYCLRCHRRLEKGFEALRPYVCSDPLCLFQYMAMGFGPSIEHEILTEPYVVDLLVSLCYSAIQTGVVRPPMGANTEPRLPIRSLPVGLRLKVPDLVNPTVKPLKARVAPGDEYLVFEDIGASKFGDRLAPAQWLAFRKSGHTLTRHARVREVNSATKTAVVDVMGESSATWGGGPRVGIDPLWAQSGSSHAPLEVDIADVYLYDTDFDSLDDASKGNAMRHILDTLPSILDIEEWLASHPHSTLRTMERISPAAASLLQWIVSSNRSCIFQVDRSRAIGRRRQVGLDPEVPNSQAPASQPPGPQVPVTATPDDPGVAGRGRNREHERILGMEGWVQFRFAQGSPDKELRFNRALQEVAARKDIEKNPTIFAWHGSNLANWHSIVRTGLDFQDVNAGRAYGNGVYFSPFHHTSMGYAGGGQSWPNSDLSIATCLSLNEIINAPDEFVSREPHYVVSQLDWHQCRYLFVRTVSGRAPPVRTTPKTAAEKKAAIQEEELAGRQFYPQASGREVQGQDGRPLRIPLSAIPLRTVGPSAAGLSGTAKRAVQMLEDSDDEDIEDVACLFSDDELDEPSGRPSKKPASRASSIDIAATQNRYGKSPVSGSLDEILTTLHSGGAGPPTPASISIDRALTDFEPGALDLSSLPRLAPPSFATDAGTRTLSRELMRMQAVQCSTPLHELGWYIDFDSVTNLFQWIVQLHSFDPSLPLAEDLKKAGLTSVVLELRFGADFPFSPPFVRVIRPRFLPFMEGGGGHVTNGGAMCMELLTSSGWSPASSLESVLLQVRMAMSALDPRPARLDQRYLAVAAAAANSTKGKAAKAADYGVTEALDAFVRAANSHGWAVPEGVRATAMGV
jgi:ubiquitin-conjugating enzyme E2 Q